MAIPLLDTWIELAAAHGSTKWLKEFIQADLPQLHQGTIAPQQFALNLSAELEARELTTPAQQKNYRSNVVQALKVIDPNHPAISLVALSADQYRDLNDAQRGRLAERETRYFTSDQAQVLVDRATTLLDSAEWSEVGAGLAVLIGRRISEILLSNFALRSPWSLSFSEMAKKAKADGLTIEIPTLAPAASVLRAIEKLQQGLRIQDLKLNSLSPKMAKQTVNQRYSEAVAAKCEQHFCDLVPARSDRDNLYTHLFRAVYATIAAHWFCPPAVPEHSFKAEIQGHFTIAADGRKLPNFSARANYDDYAIGTPDGNRDGRLGIQLGRLPGLEVLEAFRRSAVSPGVERLSGAIAPGPAADEDQDHKEGDQVAAEPEVTMTYAANSPISLDQPTVNAVRVRAANLLAQANPTAAQLAVGLQVLTGLSLSQLLQAQFYPIDPFHLSVEGVTVTTLVQQLAPYIEKLRRLPQPTPDQMQQVYRTTFAGLALPDRSIDQLYPALVSIVQESRPMSASPKMKRPELYAQDLDRLQTLMAKRGFVGSVADLFHALIEAFESRQVEYQHQQVQTLGELTASMAWFTDRIDALEKTCRELQQERDHRQASQSATEERDRLQAENDRLKQQLHETQARLEAIQQLLGQAPDTGSLPASKAISPAPQPAPIKASLPSDQLPSTQAPIAASLPSDRSLSTQAVPAHRTDTTAKIHQIIDALIAWNTSQPSLDTQVRISFPIIKAIAAAMGASYQAAIQQVLQQRAVELQQHHSRLMLGSRHNATIRNKQQILQNIAQHYLGLDTWETVKL